MSYIDRINEDVNCRIATIYEIGMDVADENTTGVEVNFHVHWDGEKYSCWIMSIDDEWLLAGNQGPRLNTNCFTMFSERCRVMDKYFEKLIPTLKRHGHIGFVNLGVTFEFVKKGKYEEAMPPKYRELYFGATDMFEVCLGRLYQVSEEDLFLEKDGKRPVDSFIRGFAGYSRVYAYPHHPEKNMEIMEGIKDGPEMFWNIDSYVVVGRGDNIAKLWNSIYTQSEMLRKYGVCWRVDGDKKARQAFYNLKQKHII